MSNLFLPSSMTGYARNKSESQYPELWDGVVGYWDFSVQGAIPRLGLARDLSGNGNHGTLVGDTHSVPGKFGPALKFDGAGDLVNCGDISQTASVAGLSVLVWMRIPTDNVPTAQRVISKSGVSGNREFNIQLRDSENVLFQVYNESDVAALSWFTDGFANVANKWRQVVGVYNGANAMTYVDGIVGSVSPALTGLTKNSTAPLIFGALDAGADIPWPGQIDHIIIWNRALSAGEIKFLYHHSKALVTPRDDIIVRSPVGGVVIERTMTDSLGITDVQTKAVTFARTFAESMGVTDATAKIAVHLRVLAESLGITDATVKAETKLLTEALGIADTQTKDETKALAESLGITDTVVRTCVVIRSFAESLGITDAVGQAAVLSRVLSDALGVTDSMTRIQGFIRTEIETLGITDDVTRTQVQLRVIADALGITDVMQRGQVVAFAETMGISDDVTKLITFIRTESEVVGVTDSIVRVAVMLRSVSDDVGLTDEVSEELSALVKAAWAFVILRQTHS